MRPTTQSQSGWLLAWLCLALSVAMPAAAAAQSAALLHLTPQSATVAAGQTVAVQVRVENVEDLYGLDIRLKFDPATVEVVDADASSDGVQILAGDLLKPDFVVRNLADNAEGTVWFALTQLNPSEAVTGSGVAFTVTFRGKSAGASSPLSITYQKLAQRSGDVIPISTEDGELRVVGEVEAATATAVAPTGTPLPTAMPATAVPTATPLPATATLLPTAEPAAPPAAPQPSATSARGATATEPPKPTALPTQVPPTAQPSSTPVPPVPTARPTDTKALPPATATPLQVTMATQRPLTPTPQPQPIQAGGPPLALIIAAVVVVGVLGYLFWRRWSLPQS